MITTGIPSTPKKKIPKFPPCPDAKPPKEGVCTCGITNQPPPPAVEQPKAPVCSCKDTPPPPVEEPKVSTCTCKKTAPPPPPPPPPAEPDCTCAPPAPPAKRECVCNSVDNPTPPEKKIVLTTKTTDVCAPEKVGNICTCKDVKGQPPRNTTCDCEPGACLVTIEDTLFFDQPTGGDNLSCLCDELVELDCLCDTIPPPCDCKETTPSPPPPICSCKGEEPPPLPADDCSCKNDTPKVFFIFNSYPSFIST